MCHGHHMKEESMAMGDVVLGVKCRAWEKFQSGTIEKMLKEWELEKRFLL